MLLTEMKVQSQEDSVAAWRGAIRLRHAQNFETSVSLHPTTPAVADLHFEECLMLKRTSSRLSVMQPLATTSRTAAKFLPL
jgi:hypothetical protein